MLIRDLLTRYEKNNKPWIICGKGPSFSRFKEINYPASHNILTLNQVIRETSAEFAHIIDAEVLNDVSEAIERNAKYLVMPYYPHFKCRPDSSLSIYKLIELNVHPVLSRMAEKGRLLCYNLKTATQKATDSPVINARFYSAEAAVHLLAELGIKEIKTLGVDGGNQQASAFKDLMNENAQTGYDRQWTNIRRVIKDYGINYGPAYLDCPIRIFVGCSDSELIPFQVLRCTIEQQTAMTVEVQPLLNWNHLIPSPKNKDLRSRTPFSFQRFLIPEICGYKGRAIYLDSDMQVFSDIKDLWERSFQCPFYVPRGSDTDDRKAQFSVFVIDCGKIRWDIRSIMNDLDSEKISYAELMHKPELPAGSKTGECPEWNSLERYEKGLTKLVHYTDFKKQPWKNRRHLLAALWEKAFREAFHLGYFKMKLIEHIQKGYVRASLCFALLDKIFWKRLLLFIKRRLHAVSV